MEAQLTGIDRDNYSKVYSMYFPKLVRFSQTFLLSRQDAENTVQDIFLYIWENIDVIGPLGNVNAYLFTLVKNR
ncbi:MAG: RNA polymerase sigma-70 factor, partial [Tannerella sp.]|nr:RNA polymerase sigma-70 factor [Tannerella sp.]